MTLSRKLALLVVEKNIDVATISDMLQKYKLSPLLATILREVKQMSKDVSKRDTVLIESPFEIDEQAVNRIKRLAGNDMAPHEVVINKNLLAGFKARFKGKLYDGSAERIIKEFTRN